MKMIIDIPEEIKSYVDRYIPIGVVEEYCFPDEIVKMIQRGTPIPEHTRRGDILVIECWGEFSKGEFKIIKVFPLFPTNGDIIKLMFPNVETNFSNVIDLNSWWNAMYRKEQ